MSSATSAFRSLLTGGYVYYPAGNYRCTEDVLVDEAQLGVVRVFAPIE